MVGKPNYLMQSNKHAYVRLSGISCFRCGRIDGIAVDSSGRCADCISMHYNID